MLISSKLIFQTTKTLTGSAMYIQSNNRLCVTISLKLNCIYKLLIEISTKQYILQPHINKNNLLKTL